MIARKLFIAGKVQGVFFREWTLGKAREHNVSGYVRNLSDGRVEVFAQGEEPAIERFAARLHEGPPSAEVKEVVQTEAEMQLIEGFTRRSTV